jgi:hypothetical protein
MPKLLFYTGTVFCLFLALCSAAEVGRELQGSGVAFAALGMAGAPAKASWAIVFSLIAGLGVAAIFLRMAALVAARNLFAAFTALFSVAGSIVSLAWVLLLQSRILILRGRGAGDSLRTMGELHLAGYLMLGYFLSLTLLAMRPYFRIQASRTLSALVFLPLPLYLLIIGQELFVTSSFAPLPASTPALEVFFSVLAVLFLSIAVHCVRHRHLFIEMTNLRELLDSRIDPPRGGRPIRLHGVAFDS